MTGPANQSRIPSTLQAIFLASNRGKDVHRPPPKSVANKVYFGNFRFQNKGNAFKRFFGGKSKRNVAAPEAPKTQAPAAKVVEKEVKPISPQVYLDLMLRSRGYSTKRHKALQSAYYNKPSALQLASYDVYLIGIIRRDDEKTFDEVMSCGLSSNPCNKYGTSLAHMVCRRGNNQMLRTLVRNGCCLSIADDYGRTPLHDACWAADPAFETVLTILESDVRQFHMIDSRGHVPLNYVREEHWSEWNQFLDANKDKLWPKDAKNKKDPPPLTLEPINTRSLPDPAGALPLEVASMVAAGRLTPEEARILADDGDQTMEMSEEGDDDLDESEFDSEDESDYDSDEDYSDDDDDSDDELLNSLPLVAR